MARSLYHDHGWYDRREIIHRPSNHRSIVYERPMAPVRPRTTNRGGMDQDVVLRTNTDWKYCGESDIIGNMNPEEIRELLAREPFQPFRVRATSGDSYDVQNPALAVAMKSRLFIAVPDSDHWTLVPYLHIATVESLANGHHPTRRKKRR